MADENTDLASISGMASSEMPVVLPWHLSSSIRLGQEDPWAKESLFKHSSLNTSSAQFSSKDGRRASFKSTSSFLSRHFEDHMSIGLGISVGCSILGAGVSTRYDKHVMNDRRVNRLHTEEKLQLLTLLGC